MKHRQLSVWICLLGIVFVLTGCSLHTLENTDHSNEELPTKEVYDDSNQYNHAEEINAAKQDAYDRGYHDGYLNGEEAIQSIAEEDATTSQIPDGFVVISDFVPDVILEVRYYSTYNFVGRRIDGYEAPVAILTREAAEALKEVSDELGSRGYRLKIYDAYRPQCAVDHFQKWAEDMDDTLMKDYFTQMWRKKIYLIKGILLPGLDTAEVQR